MEMYQLFILTRFNLLLWNKDKRRDPVRSVKWLEHRFELFERYCLPSIVGQTCQEFKWIVLFDSTTPERFRDRIVCCQKKCPQLMPVYVKPEEGHNFSEIFSREVKSRLSEGNGGKVLTIYLDNDDSLDIHFVEDVRLRAMNLEDGTFITYEDGYQLFTDYQYMMRVHYPRNHFISVLEKGDSSAIKTVYGYGSHYYIDKIPGVKIERVKGCPLWCEVIHERNMGNDAYFLNARMVKDEDLLTTHFGVHKALRHGPGIYLFRFLPRYCKTFVRRIEYRLFGRKW